MITLAELRTLDDAAFNKAVAMLVGYSVVRDEKCPPEREQWFDVYLNGEYAGYVPATNADEAWDRALEKDYEGSRYVPDYATNFNAAWALCVAIEMFDGVEIDPAVASYVARLTTHEVYTGAAKHPARALATAWCAWKLAQMRGGG